MILVPFTNMYRETGVQQKQVQRRFSGDRVGKITLVHYGDHLNGSLQACMCGLGFFSCPWLVAYLGF
jgi:hypothetical protein